MDRDAAVACLLALVATEFKKLLETPGLRSLMCHEDRVA
jgi:hypothetical protein